MKFSSRHGFSRAATSTKSDGLYPLILCYGYASSISLAQALVFSETVSCELITEDSLRISASSAPLRFPFLFSELHEFHDTCENFSRRLAHSPLDTIRGATSISRGVNLNTLAAVHGRPSRVRYSRMFNASAML